MAQSGQVDLTITNTVTLDSPTLEISQQPLDQAVYLGETVSFSAAASGDPAPTLQWQVSADHGTTWSDIPDATASPLIFTPSLAQNGNLYRAVFTNSPLIFTPSLAQNGNQDQAVYSNSAGSVTSDMAVLAVWEPGNPDVYDDFNDNHTDRSIWNVDQEGGATLAETNRRIEVTIPASVDMADYTGGYTSACLLHGDYDIQVDYELPVWQPTSGVLVYFGDNNVNLDRISLGPYDYEGAKDVYWTDTTGHGDASRIGMVIPTSDLSGKLRVQRVADTVNSLIFTNNAWMLIASHSHPEYAEDTIFYVSVVEYGANLFGGQEVRVAFDNVIVNHGELLCPSNDSPSVTLNQATGQADPTGSSPILFTATFSEPVTGFGDSTADVILSGAAGATTAAVSGGPTTYTVSVSGMANPGAVIASIPAGAAVDGGSNLNTPSTSTDNTITYDAQVTGQITPVSASCAQFAAGIAPNLNEILYTLNFGRFFFKIKPESFTYYTRVVAPAATFKIYVTQSHPTGWLNLFFDWWNSDLFDANCNQHGVFINLPRGQTTTFTVHDATPGGVYYLSTRYRALWMGKKVNPYLPNATYTLTTALNNTPLNDNTDSVTYHP
jgi:hypothetical protein